ncbi:MAG: hypothetical protein ACE5ET_06675 [Gammaproteobacteria bacterium]
MEKKFQSKPRITAHVREFRVPPLRDGLILGRDASVGCIAIRKALDLLTAYNFAHIEPDDDVVGDIIVRESFLKRLSREDLITFVLQEIKPHMNRDEILEVELDIVVEITTE